MRRFASRRMQVAGVVGMLIAVLAVVPRPCSSLGATEANRRRLMISNASLAFFLTTKRRSLAFCSSMTERCSSWRH